MGMSYKEWNDVIKDVANTYKKFPQVFGLSPNVVLDFRRNEEKTLSIKAFSKIVEKSGLSFEITIKDSNGEEIDGNAFKEFIIKKIKNINKDSDEVISNILPNKNLTDKIESNKRESNKEEFIEMDLVEDDEEHLTILTEAKIDLSEIFADEG